MERLLPALALMLAFGAASAAPGPFPRERPANRTVAEPVEGQWIKEAGDTTWYVDLRQGGVYTAVDETGRYKWTGDWHIDEEGALRIREKYVGGYAWAMWSHLRLTPDTPERKSWSSPGGRLRLVKNP